MCKRWVVFWGMIMLTAGVACAAGEEYEIPLEPGTVKLAGPFQVTRTDYFLDGGTMVVDLKDSQGAELSVYLDGRMQFLKFMEKPRPAHVFINAYPNDEGKGKVPIGGKTEKIVEVILQEWAASQNIAEEEAKAAQAGNPKDFKFSENYYKVLSVRQMLKQMQGR